MAVQKAVLRRILRTPWVLKEIVESSNRKIMDKEWGERQHILECICHLRSRPSCIICFSHIWKPHPTPSVAEVTLLSLSISWSQLCLSSYTDLDPTLVLPPKIKWLQPTLHPQSSKYHPWNCCSAQLLLTHSLIHDWGHVPDQFPKFTSNKFLFHSKD